MIVSCLRDAAFHTDALGKFTAAFTNSHHSFPMAQKSLAAKSILIMEVS